MTRIQRIVRNLVFGLGLAVVLGNAAVTVYAASCDITVNCPGGSGTVYCWCDNTPSASCTAISGGCHYDCGDFSGNTWCN
jgi:hypothetical protein